MKRIIIISFFTLFSFHLFGQSTFIWGAELHPNYSERRLIAITQFFSDSTLRAIDSIEMGKLSFSGGLFLGWKGEKVSFETGLSFMESGYKTLKGPADDNRPIPAGALLEQNTFQSFYIELPTRLQFFHTMETGSEFSFSMGVSLSYNISNLRTTTYFLENSNQEEKTKFDQEAYRKFNYAFEAGMGWGKKLNENFAIFIQPTFKFWFKGMLVENKLNRSLYSLGVRTGVRFE